MYAILFRALAKPGKREELLAFLKRDCEESRSEEGTIRFDVVEDPENRNAFYVYEAYLNQRDFHLHKEGKAYGEWVDRIQPDLAAFRILFAGQPETVLVKKETVLVKKT